MQDDSQSRHNLLNPKSVTLTGDGVGGVSHNRKMNSLTTRQSTSWGDGVEILKVEIEIIMRAAATAEFPPVAGVAFDAPTDGLADLWLADDAATIEDTQLDTVTLGKPLIKYFPKEDFPNGLIRLDAIRLKGTDNFDLIIKAN